MDALVILMVVVVVLTIVWIFGASLDQAFLPTKVGGGTVTRLVLHPTTPPVTQVEAGLPLALAALSGQHIRTVDIRLDDGTTTQFDGSPPVLLQPGDRLICTYRIGRTGRRYVSKLEKHSSPPDDQ